MRSKTTKKPTSTSISWTLYLPSFFIFRSSQILMRPHGRHTLSTSLFLNRFTNDRVLKQQTFKNYTRIEKLLLFGSQLKNIVIIRQATLVLLSLQCLLIGEADRFFTIPPQSNLFAAKNGKFVSHLEKSTYDYVWWSFGNKYLK